MTTAPEERTMVEGPPATSTPLDELRDVRRSLQEAGLALLQAATAAINAAAKDTLGATVAVVSAAEGTLAAAEEKLRKLRERIGVQAPPGAAQGSPPKPEEESRGASSPG